MELEKGKGQKKVMKSMERGDVKLKEDDENVCRRIVLTQMMFGKLC